MLAEALTRSKPETPHIMADLQSHQLENVNADQE
jgi:hypothetical protein